MIKNHNTDLEEVVPRKPIYTRSKRQGEGREGRMNNGAGKGQRKNRKGCGISNGLGQASIHKKNAHCGVGVSA